MSHVWEAERGYEAMMRDQVYKWQEQLPQRPRSTRYPHYSSEEQASSSSGSEFGSHRGRSFQGPHNRNRRGNRTNPGTTTRGATNRIQTRSQVGTNPLVYNISSKTLTHTEMSLLQKGLSFCPTPNFDTFKLEQELNRFFRTLRLKVHFQNINTNTERPAPLGMFTLKETGLRNPSSYNPPRHHHPIETYITLVQRDITSVITNIRKGQYRLQHNFSHQERLALNSLTKDKELIIKPADKGGAMDRSYYITEIHSQLNDNNTYIPIDRDPTPNIRQDIHNILDKYVQNNTIDSQLQEFLINHHPVTPVFYTLPKIYKNLQTPPGRPIVASTDSILSPLAKFVEKILTPIIRCTRSFLLDTSDFLTHIKNSSPVSPESILVTLDVCSLYTCIPHTEGLQATRNLLNNETNLTHNQKEFCLELLHIILTKNYFLFGDQYYMQIAGTAIGSNVAPPYANAFMAQFENDVVYTHPLSCNIRIWKRFIDDIFCIWTGTDDTLKQFFNDINTHTPGLKFTIHSDTTTINFLDTQVTKDTTGHISTDLYVKPTDRNSLLHYTSCHPRSVKNSLPKSQYCRVQRIVSDDNTRQSRLREMADKFANRGYPPSTTGTYRTMTIHNTRTTEPKPLRVAFVNTYHPFSPRIQKNITAHWDLLAKAYPDITEFQQPPLMCHKRPPNLRDRLVKADIGLLTKTSRQTLLASKRKGTFPCLHCHQCSVTKGPSATHPYRQKVPYEGILHMRQLLCGISY
ncbi:uncharacterized protein [Dendropsophus ebraccatus]|uniref:uncharacterized protein n=1 Tax=Dendropsophus ebraccatus TaxID=150705 RepID=UPI0038320DC4